jgi:hypothetical protein
METATRTESRAQQAFGQTLAPRPAASQNPRPYERLTTTDHRPQLDVTMLQALLFRNSRRKHSQINLQQNATSRIARPSISNRHNQHAAPWTTDRALRITSGYSPNPTHSLSSRHSSRLENALSRRKQTLGTRSNRHFLRVSECHQRRIADPARPPHVASNIVSNRQWQILEIAKNSTKTPFSGVLIGTKTRLLRLRFHESCRRTPGVWGSRFMGPRATNRGSQPTNHASLRPVVYLKRTRAAWSSYQ